MIDTAALGFALGAGLVAALNPCGFAFLPGYLGLVIVGEGQPTTRPAALARAGTATLAMAAGFVTVFGVFGLVISPLIASAQRYLPFATVVIGVLLVALGLWLLSGRDITVIMPKLSGGTPTARLRSMYGYGVAYAVASLSCTIAPFLAVIGTTFRQGEMLTGMLAFLAYAVGMALTVGVAAIAVALLGALGHRFDTPDPAPHQPHRRRRSAAHGALRHLLRLLRDPAVLHRRRRERPDHRGSGCDTELASSRGRPVGGMAAGGHRCHSRGRGPPVARPLSKHPHPWRNHYHD